MSNSAQRQASNYNGYDCNEEYKASGVILKNK